MQQETRRRCPGRSTLRSSAEPNSALQAAAHLARHARVVHLIVRGSTLAHGASDYLVEQVEALPNVTVHLNSEIAEARDDQQLRRVVVRDRTSGEARELSVAGLFVMIGAVPRTDWLPAELARDNPGFVLTGEDGPPVQAPGPTPAPRMRRRSRASSPWAMSVPARSSASPRPWVRARRPCSK